MAHIPDPLQALGKICGEQCDVTVGTRAHFSTPPHSHPTHNHVLVSEGTLYLTQDGIERAVTAGQWCSIPAGSEHAERFVETTSVIVFWVKPREPGSA
jgi:quercetin dioxygenase-like cupin family protein